MVAVVAVEEVAMGVTVVMVVTTTVLKPLRLRMLASSHLWVPSKVLQSQPSELVLHFCLLVCSMMADHLSNSFFGGFHVLESSENFIVLFKSVNLDVSSGVLRPWSFLTLTCMNTLSLHN